MSTSEPIQQLSAVTLRTGDMSRAVAFYESLGFRRVHTEPDGSFTSLAAGPSSFLNLMAFEGPPPAEPWGRVIFYVGDVDAFYQRVLDAGHRPDHEPRDAPWGERHFHIDDPDGHRLSFARPLASPPERPAEPTPERPLDP